MRVVLHIPDGLEDQPFVGMTLAAWLARLVEEAGHALSPVDEGDLALHVDGRFAAVRAESLGRLRLPGDALTTPDGVSIAGIGHGWDEIRGGDAVSHDEAWDVRTAVGRGRAERVVRRRLVERLERAGVQIVDPDRTLVDATVRVEPGATLWPEVVLRGHTHVAAGAEIRPGCWLEDTEVGEGALVKPHCVCEGAHIGPGSQVGPMAHLRPGARLEGDNKVGNFVEVKKARLGRGAKASHLTYLGDATIGEGANIGAGTITCNYDGHRKHRTDIGAGAFIGSNTALVAPVRVGAGAIVGAGSTLTRDVDDDALAVERGTLKVLAGKGKALNDRNARLKARERAAKADGER